MNKAIVAAIASAINAYIEQEEQIRTIPHKITPYPEISSWRLFGRQELMRARTRWQVRKTSQ